MKIYQSAFVKNLVIKKRLTNCNANIIPMKAGSSIKMIDPKDSNKTNPHIYQKLVEKLVYLFCGIKTDIVFAIRQFSKHNADPRKEHCQAAK